MSKLLEKYIFETTSAIFEHPICGLLTNLLSKKTTTSETI